MVNEMLKTFQYMNVDSGKHKVIADKGAFHARFGYSGIFGGGGVVSGVRYS